jgi:hypothetical protein
VEPLGGSENAIKQRFSALSMNGKRTKPLSFTQDFSWQLQVPRAVPW